MNLRATEIGVCIILALLMSGYGFPQSTGGPFYWSKPEYPDEYLVFAWSNWQTIMYGFLKFSWPITEVNANVIGDSHRVHRHSKWRNIRSSQRYQLVQILELSHTSPLPFFLTKLCLIVFFCFPVCPPEILDRMILTFVTYIKVPLVDWLCI